MPEPVAPLALRRLTWESRVAVQAAAITCLLSAATLAIAGVAIADFESAARPGARAALAGGIVSVLGTLGVLFNVRSMREDTGVPAFTFMFVACILGALCHTAGAMVNGLADQYAGPKVLNAPLIAFCVLTALAEIGATASSYRAARSIEHVKQGMYIGKRSRSKPSRVRPR